MTARAQPVDLAGEAEQALGQSLAGNAGRGVGSGTSTQGGSPGASGAGVVGGSDPGGSAGVGADAPRGPGTLVWSADHERGDLDQWQDGGDYYGGEYEWGSGSISVNDGTGRNGSRGLVSYTDTDYRDEPSQGARVYRRIEGAPPYYSVWLALAQRHSVSEWWSIFLFHAHDSTQTLENDVSLRDIRVVEDDAGAMTLQFFDHDTMRGTVHAWHGVGAPRFRSERGCCCQRGFNYRKRTHVWCGCRSTSRPASVISGAR